MNDDDRAAELRRRLWADSALGVAQGEEAKYNLAILEQYKLYVEMADRVSHRRTMTNTYFLSLNTAIFALIGVFWNGQTLEQPWWFVIPLIALQGQCFAWYYILRSYRLLNAAKYQVVGMLEERLPASPYWRAEWWALGEGRDPTKYWPLTHIEQWVPVLFAGAYIGGFLVVLIA